MTIEYGKSFLKWRESSSKPWAAFTTHEFVVGLGTGMLAEEAFLRYLRQDYIFLLHFARAWALAVVKSDNLDEMRMSANLVDALLNDEMDLHVKTCQEKGISREELENTTELPQNMAYTRYVLEAGFSGDFLDLMAALAPCVMGYGEIGARLKVERTSDLYIDWINTYSSQDYQNLCIDLGKVIDSAITRRLGRNFHECERWDTLVTHFQKATTLESSFWEMGLKG